MLYLKIGDRRIQVCKVAFLKTLQIGRTRFQNIAKCKKLNLEANHEKRGGHKAIKRHLQESIKQDIGLYKCTQSHYARAGAVHRNYLPSELSVNKMFKTFISKNPHIACTYEYYLGVFKGYFNLGFGSPKKDVCSTCVKLISLS